MKVCAYCKQECDDEYKKCPNCQSQEFEEPKSWWRPSPEGQSIFYNGYVVWVLHDEKFWADRCSFYFYLGDKLVETIVLDRDVMRQFVPEGESVMAFVWDLFRVAVGEEEVLRVQEQNKHRPATFEIRRVPSEREEWLASLTRSDVLTAALTGEFSRT